jgi:hypothetical protein
MTVRAIQTSYAGYWFRSRLEARWAVALDFCQIGWQYEVQGVHINLSGIRLRWLPDFLLENDQYAEVKGELNASDAARLLTIAAGVGGECGSGRDVVVLGRIPRSGEARWPVQLHHHDHLWALPWDLHTGCPLKQHRPRLSLRLGTDIDMLLKGMPAAEPGWAVGALDAARQARFEHGEQPRTS